MNNLPHEGEEIVFVELNPDGSPYQVFTGVYDEAGRWKESGSMYDIERSKTSGSFLMSDSGGGDVHLQNPKSRWWMREGFPADKVDVYDGRGNVTGDPPDPANRVADDHVLEFEGLEGGPFAIARLADEVRVVDMLVNCCECQDWFDGDETDNPCPHTRWCELCGWWSTPDEPCKHDKKGG